VVCADLWSAPASGFFHALYFATNDVYCQNLSSRAFVTCAGITETPAISGERFTCAFWGESVRTSVRLPSGTTVSTTVLATPHHSFSCTA
jgi:hypothetical protein